MLSLLFYKTHVPKSAGSEKVLIPDCGRTDWIEIRVYSGVFNDCCQTLKNLDV